MRFVRTLVGVFVLLLALIPQASLHAQLDSDTDGSRVPTVAILDFTGFMLDAAMNSGPLGKAVTVMMITEFGDREGIQVIERDAIKRIMDEQALALSGMVENSSAVEVGELLGVQYMIFGASTAAGETMRIDMRVVDVETSATTLAEKLSARPEEMLDLVVRAADRFMAELNLTSRTERVAMAQIPPQATVAFSRGIDFEDNGKTEEAIEQYQLALELHPDHREAQAALQRLRGQGDDR